VSANTFGVQKKRFFPQTEQLKVSRNFSLLGPIYKEATTVKVHATVGNIIKT
jgi:hypothetical protein